jgi:hypothetical protein
MQYLSQPAHRHANLSNSWRAHPKSPCPNPLFQPAHLIAMPQSFILAGASNRHAAIHYLSQLIHPLHTNPLFQPAHPIAAPTHQILAGTSPIATLSSIISVSASNCHANLSIVAGAFDCPSPL